MAQIYTIGETVYDIIYDSTGKIQKGVPGGAMLNTSVSLGRMKLPVSLITEIGNDSIGDIIAEFLNRNSVNTTYIYRFDEGKTAISLAFLTEEKDAAYSFYKQYPEKRLDQNIPEFQNGDLVLFGSFFSLKIRFANLC